MSFVVLHHLAPSPEFTFSHELERQHQRQSTIDHPFVLEKRLVLNLTKRGDSS